MGQKMVVYVPHMVVTVLEQKGGHWLSPSRMLWLLDHLLPLLLH